MSPPTRAIPKARASGHSQASGSDGPNMIVILLGVAVLVGLLVGLGAHQLTHQPTSRPATARLTAPPSSKAVDLGYKNERDFSVDTQRTAEALEDVLDANPGAQRLWENAESGNRGVFWVSAESPRADNRSCRDIERRAVINNAFSRAIGTVCRSTTGGWNASIDWHAK